MKLRVFSKAIPYLGDDLTLKHSEQARTILGVTFEESMRIFSLSTVCKIEDYLLQFTINPQTFNDYAKKALSVIKLKKLTGNNKQTLEILKEMWQEISMLRKIAAFIKLNFGDPISKAILCESTDLAGISRSVIKKLNIVIINYYI